MDKEAAIEATREVLMPAMVENYAATSASKDKEWFEPLELDLLVGSTYAKIVEVKDGRPRCVKGFVVLKEKKFPIGTMLKAAGYKAPATNFGRGMVDDPESWNFVAWTGIG